MFAFWFGVVYMVVTGDFPGYNIMGVHEDSAALVWVYDLACDLGHKNMCS